MAPPTHHSVADLTLVNEDPQFLFAHLASVASIYDDPVVNDALVIHPQMISPRHDSRIISACTPVDLMSGSIHKSSFVPDWTLADFPHLSTTVTEFGATMAGWDNVISNEQASI